MHQMDGSIQGHQQDFDKDLQGCPSRHTEHKAVIGHVGHRLGAHWGRILNVISDCIGSK